MPNYAQLLADGVCFAVSQTHSPIEGPDLVEVPAYDESYIGKRHVGGGVFESVAPPARPRIVILSIAADAEHAAGTVIAGSEVTCPAGATITVHAQLQAPGGGGLVALTDQFRMPMRSRDRRERMLLARMVDGAIEITAPMRDSGVWAVTEAMVNEGLPDAAHMAFDGITIYVYEA